MSNRCEYRSKLFELSETQKVDRIEELETALDRMLNPNMEKGEQYCNPVACENARVALTGKHAEGCFCSACLHGRS